MNTSSLLVPVLPSDFASRPETLGVQVQSLKGSNPLRLDSPESLLGKIVLIGIPDERGVTANSGNPGAAEGPHAFRSAFYRLYDCELRRRSENQSEPDTFTLSERIVDLGDVRLQESVSSTHDALSSCVSLALDRGASLVIVVGGGHDFSYGSFSGHYAHTKSLTSVINFDAHLDVRPIQGGVINSGTPFYRVIENHGEAVAGGAALLELGIQPDRNPPSLYRYASEHRVPIVEHFWMQREWLEHTSQRTASPLEHVFEHLDRCTGLGWKRYLGPIHLSLDLDVFASWIAPGTSASTPFGAHVEDLAPVFAFLARQNNCKVFDIAELCPARDVNSQTAKLAATLVYHFCRTRLEFGHR